MNPDTSLEFDAYGRAERPTISASAVQVAAAMVAVVADHEGWYSPGSSALMDVRGTGCIQGAMLAKLGYPFAAGRSHHGATDDVMQMMGMTRWDTWAPDSDREQSRLFQALNAAQQANDGRLPWSAALEAFERVMAGEDPAVVLKQVRAAEAALRDLRDRKHQRETLRTLYAHTAPTPPALLPAWQQDFFKKLVDQEMAAMQKLLWQANAYEGPGVLDLPVIHKYAGV